VSAIGKLKSSLTPSCSKYPLSARFRATPVDVFSLLLIANSAIGS
jgi:hypothetical protein